MDEPGVWLCSLGGFPRRGEHGTPIPRGQQPGRTSRALPAAGEREPLGDSLGRSGPRPRWRRKPRRQSRAQSCGRRGLGSPRLCASAGLLLATLPVSFPPSPLQARAYLPGQAPGVGSESAHRPEHPLPASVPSPGPLEHPGPSPVKAAPGLPLHRTRRAGANLRGHPNIFH